MFDCIIVGAGLAGAVFARQMAVSGRRVLVVEKRSHIAGNCYDHFDENGILIHKYGPHLFHTSNREVFHFLSQFTDWRQYQHRVLADIDGCRIPLPFNLNSLHLLLPNSMASVLEEKLIKAFGFGVKVPILKLRKSGDEDLQWLAEFIYEKVFLQYTLKQWGGTPEQIDPQVTGRVPVSISRDGRYFQDRYQVVPEHGYTRLFAKMMDHPDIHLLLNTRFQDVVRLVPETKEIVFLGRRFDGDLIFTGMIDELFDFAHGMLPYRSLQFRCAHYSCDYYQDAAVVNYPNNYDFTRITEFKRISGQQAVGTTVMREYPCAYKHGTGMVPCYPLTDRKSVDLYQLYRREAEQIPRLTLTGRLAEYRYFDMDDVVAEVLELFEEKFC